MHSTRGQGRQNRDVEWYVIGDDGTSVLRIVPGLALGETASGALTLNDRNSDRRWICFEEDEDGSWLEATDHVFMATQTDGAVLTREFLRPGLVLRMPHNTLHISTDALIIGEVGRVLTVQPIDAQADADGADGEETEQPEEARAEGPEVLRLLDDLRAQLGLRAPSSSRGVSVVDDPLSELNAPPRRVERPDDDDFTDPLEEMLARNAPKAERRPGPETAEPAVGASAAAAGQGTEPRSDPADHARGFDRRYEGAAATAASSGSGYGSWTEARRRSARGWLGGAFAAVAALLLIAIAVVLTVPGAEQLIRGDAVSGESADRPLDTLADGDMTGDSVGSGDTSSAAGESRDVSSDSGALSAALSNADQALADNRQPDATTAPATLDEPADANEPDGVDMTAAESDGASPTVASSADAGNAEGAEGGSERREAAADPMDAPATDTVAAPDTVPEQIGAPAVDSPAPARTEPAVATAVVPEQSSTGTAEGPTTDTGASDDVDSAAGVSAPAGGAASDARLERARDLLYAGDITFPPGNNAVALLLPMLRADPNRPEVRALLEECSERMIHTAEQLHERGLHYEARNTLEEVLKFDPDSERAQSLMTRWVEFPS